MAASISPSCSHLLRLHHFRHRGPHPPPRPPPLSSSTLLSLFFFRPLSLLPSSIITAAAAFSAATPILSSSPKLTPLTALFTSGPSASLAVRSRSILRRSISSGAFPQTPSSHVEASVDGEENDDEILDFDEEEDEYDDEIDDFDEEDEVDDGIVAETQELPYPEPKENEAVRPVNGKKGPGLSLNLSVKEKKELASYAHGLGKKLKCQLVGKSGVTDNVASSFVETLEANELLKIKIHRTCPGELDEVVERLEALTGSVVVGQIGRTVIVYRPSLAKLKAEEKKKQAQRVFMRKRLKPRPELVKGGQASRMTARPRRGSSRV